MDRVDNMMNMQYGQIFEPSAEKIKTRYLELVKIYHPDTWKDKRADDFMAFISEKKKEALLQLEEGVWKKEGKISFQMQRGGWCSFEYDEEYEFELGKMYMAAEKIIYMFDSENMDFYENAVNVIQNFRFANDEMEREFSPKLPRLVRTGITKSKMGIVVLEKDKHEYPLGSVLEKMGGRLDARHVAWIISRLCSICCYLQYSSLVSNGLIIENLFVNPFEHTISLYGGWWYSVKENEKMNGTTPEVYDVMTRECKDSKRAQCLTDQEMVYEIAKTLLDNKSLVFTAKEKSDIPEPVVNWIRAGSCGDAFENFDIWNKTLDAGWGKRRFVKMDVPGLVV